MGRLLFSLPAIWLIFFCFNMVASVTLENSVSSTSIIVCPKEDLQCMRDRLGYEAIKQLHKQIDDDENGSLDRSESDGFFRDELKHENGHILQVNFHGSDDLISVNDLWELWIQSSVYNWTVDDVLDWLDNHVELPQYHQLFRINAVDGPTLPRLAVNGQYMSTILGIKNGVNKQKLSLKAMDAVLFGPPKRHSWWKDGILVALLVVAVGGGWLAMAQHRYSQRNLHKVLSDLQEMQKAESSLNETKSKLEKARKEQQSVVEEKQHLEKKLQSEIVIAKSEAERLRETREATAEEIGRLKLAEQELVQVRKVLRKAEKELEIRDSVPLAQLQQWLQLSYEIETRHFEDKREEAERQFHIAKEMCDKIRKKRGAFLGSLRIAHTTSFDETDSKILAARESLEEMKRELQERSQRWKQIEAICGFSIVSNPGLPLLEAALTSQNYTGLGITCRGIGSSIITPVDESDEDLLAAGISSSRRSAPDAKVWPHLMQAGMQLTALGLGLTAPTFTGTGEKRVPSLTAAYASSPSLSNMSGSTASAFQKPRASIPTSQPAKNSDDSDQSEDYSAVSLDLSPKSTDSIKLDNTESRSNSLPATLNGKNSNGQVTGVNSNYQKSYSVDAETRKASVRPQVLQTSLSAPGSLQKPEQSSGTKCMSAIREQSPVSSSGSLGSPSSPSPTDELHSSRDSLNSLTQKDKKKKKKNKILSLLKSSTDRKKVSE